MLDLSELTLLQAEGERAAHLEGVFLECGNDVSKKNLRSQSVTMIHNRFPITAVPGVQLDTATASFQGPAHTQTHTHNQNTSRCK